MKTLWMFFSDPVLRAPTLGSMLMCLAASLVGVVAFLRKRSLIGEALSHAAFPGLVLGALLASMLGVLSGLGFMVWVLTGGFVCALLGVYSIDFLEKKARISQDAALCFVLATFFGLGVTLSSIIQFSHALLYRQVLSFVYGQAATLQDGAVILYLGFALLVIWVVLTLYGEIQISCFDKLYAKSIGVNTRKLDFILFVLIAFSVVVGVRSVGIVLMAAMLITPAATARQFTNKLGILFLLAGIFGAFSGLMGNILSYLLSIHFSAEARLSFPTGPLIVLVSCFIGFMAFLFAPKRGRLIRFIRVLFFRFKCFEENLLKSVWREKQQEKSCTVASLRRLLSLPWVVVYLLLKKMEWQGWIHLEKTVMLTSDGNIRAEKIVRLHRLWELYLVQSIHMGEERVHKSAEEMEHILTPEIESQLVEHLANPLWDPHLQPIPKNRKGGAL